MFPEPQALLTSTPEVPGLDRRKMSKSYGNAIALSMTADETARLIRQVAGEIGDAGAPDQVSQVLLDGNRRANEAATRTLDDVHAAMGTRY